VVRIATPRRRFVEVAGETSSHAYGSIRIAQEEHMASIDEQIRNQIANIEASTGRSLAEWIEVVRASGIEKHAAAVALLKADHGLGHGNANLIVIKAREAAFGGAPTEDQLVESQYAGRNAALRPAYDAVISTVRGFGDDVELAPKKAYVSLRRSKQFGQVGPAAGQLEVCVNLPGKAPTDRLRPTSGMATHRVRIADADGLDAELIGWLREAYDRA
jgi:predicted transport protein